jgi:predicted  nucleic acid-binding Zn-ribbon protein
MWDGPTVNLVLLSISALVSACTPVMLAIISRRQQETAREVASNVAEVRVKLAESTSSMEGRVEGIKADVHTTATKVTDKVEEVRAGLAGQTDIIEGQLTAIHTSVNGERAAMQAELKAMHQTILQLTSRNLNLETRHTEDVRRGEALIPVEVVKPR